MNMDLHILKNLMLEMSKLGAAQMMKMTSPVSDNLSQREAYRAYGEARIKAWVLSGLISKVRSGSTIRSKFIYSRVELMAAESAEKLNHHL